jgi:hypothetical protein
LDGLGEDPEGAVDEVPDGDAIGRASLNGSNAGPELGK